MAGVRLVHDTIRGGTFIVEHPRRRYRVPYLCPACGTVHQRKTYHLAIDGEGAVIVSPKVFERLRESGLPGLQVSNEVRNPPTIRLEIGNEVKVFEPQGVARAGDRLPRLTVLRNKLLQPRRKPYG